MCNDYSDYLSYLRRYQLNQKSQTERVDEIIKFAKENLSFDLEYMRDSMMESLDEDLEFTYLGPGQFEKDAFDKVYNCILKSNGYVYYLLVSNGYDSRIN